MAGITTIQEKFSVLNFNDWTYAAIPQSTNGLGSDDQKWFLHGFPTQAWNPDEPVAVVVDWITHHRRRRRR